MNERIKELEKEAIASLRHKPFSMEQFHEKFALLIVQECIRLCDQVDLVGADDCIDNIKEHFEVE